MILTVDAISSPLTGIGRYASELARRLPLDPDIEQLRLFAAFEWVQSIDAALDANRVVATIRRRIPFKGLALRAAWTLRQALFSRGARALRGHVLHTPNFIPFEHDGPVVTTVHDLSWIHEPRHHPPERVAFMQRMMPRAMARADIVITDSVFVRDEVLAHWPVPQDKLRVAPLGVDERFRPRPRKDCIDVLRRHGLDTVEYLLTVATLEPRKNLVGLVEAHASLPERLRRRHPLVVVGAPGWRFDAAARRIEPMATAGHVRMLGYVNEVDLPQLYAAAHGFAYLSLYEGFGLPPLESLASGTPTLVSNRASLPEVVGDAALRVEPDDSRSVADALRKLLDDSDWRVSARMKGPPRAAQYSWERCVRATVAAYRQAAAAA